VQEPEPVVAAEPPSEVPAPAPSTEPIAVSLTAAEVAKHATAEDCWMIIEGNVYNLSNFPAVHPGGPQIAGMCGKDATQLFQTRAGKGPHPETAQVKLETMLLGPLEAG
jgi:cytochrome b involved in lipid metabolism